MQRVMEDHFTHGQDIQDRRTGVIEADPGIVADPQRKAFGVLNKQTVGGKITAFISGRANGRQVGHYQ